MTLIGLSHAIPRDRGNDHISSALDLAVARSVLSALLRKKDGTERMTDGTDRQITSETPEHGHGTAFRPEQPSSKASLTDPATSTRMTPLRRRTDRQQDEIGE